MSLDRVLENSGVELNEFNKPVGPASKTAMARVINAIRKYESTSNAEFQEVSTKLANALEENATLREQLDAARRELAKERVREVAGNLDLTRADQQKLIAAAVD